MVEVHTQPKGPQIVLSRTDPRLLVKLFEMEVPEIYDGTVIIKNAVRAPGERAKVAVISRERDVDPVGACVGMKGSRVQSIIRELRGEKIDIIEYSEDLVTFAQSALAPARITRVSVTHQGEVPHLDVIVEDEQLSLAIGKRGQNVRLASELIGCRIDIKSESDVKDEVADALARMLQTAVSEARARRGARCRSISPRRRASVRRPPRSSRRPASPTSAPCWRRAPRSSRRSTAWAPQTAEGLKDWAEGKAAELEGRRPRGGAGARDAGGAGQRDDGGRGLHGRPVARLPGERGLAPERRRARRRRRGGGRRRGGARAGRRGGRGGVTVAGRAAGREARRPRAR